MKKDEFYIGWSEETPTWYTRFSMVVIGTIVIITLALTVLWLSKSNNFASSNFDFGNETIYEGTIYEYPAPVLVVKEAEDTIAIPLVNFGKAGVAEPVNFFKSQMRNNLRNYEVKLRGTRIEFDGKTWLELTREDRALLSFEKLEATSPDLKIESLGRKELTGEIVDPKCFFGVMKPGYGKAHLSCAVSCISGGIPPILVVPEEDGTRSYYFVTGRNGEPINQEILPFIGFPVTVSGLGRKVLNWNVLEIRDKGISIAKNYPYKPIFENCDQPGLELELADASTVPGK